MATNEGEPKPLRKHQAIATQLGTAILSGEYQPGDCLEGEIEQSLAMGVSRTAYREAMRFLIAKGLLESRPKAGTHVTPRHRWNLLDPDVLAWMFTRRPDPHFVRDLFELRGIVEPAAAALAAQRRTQAVVIQARRLPLGLGAVTPAKMAEETFELLARNRVTPVMHGDLNLQLAFQRFE